EADCCDLHGGWLLRSGLPDSNPAWHSDAVSGSHPPHLLSGVPMEKQTFNPWPGAPVGSLLKPTDPVDVPGAVRGDAQCLHWSEPALRRNDHADHLNTRQYARLAGSLGRAGQRAAVSNSRLDPTGN